MKAVFPDGRIFETQPFIKILFDPTKPVYQYEFETADRTVKSSARHLWGVWNKITRDVDMIRMDELNTMDYELLVQSCGQDDEYI